MSIKIFCVDCGKHPHGNKCLDCKRDLCKDCAIRGLCDDCDGENHENFLSERNGTPRDS